MNILHLEDRGSVAYFFSRNLETRGHNILRAFNINDAQSYWNDRQSVPIDCIIIDLQVPMDGLTNEQIDNTEGGILAGWIWLHDEVLSTCPQMKRKSIIYSDFLSVLNNKIPSKQLKGIKLVFKDQRNSSDEIVEYINEISKLGEK